jgi:hypothetical protein
MIGASQRIRFVLMRYGLHEIDSHGVVATTVAADRDEALEWFSEKLRLMLTFEGDPSEADYLLKEVPESLAYMAYTAKPTIPVSVVRAMAVHSLRQHKAPDVARPVLKSARFNWGSSTK